MSRFALLALCLLLSGCAETPGSQYARTETSADHLPSKDSEPLLSDAEDLPQCGFEADILDTSDTSPECEETLAITGSGCVDLIARQHLSAGSVCVSLEDDTLRVTFEMIGGWTLDEAHLWVGTDIGDLPLNRAGNPVPGQFPYAAEGHGQTSLSFLAPLPRAEECPWEVLIAAHAAVNHPERPSETAWGNGDDVGSGWAMLSAVEVSCSCEEPEEDCETAFAIGQQTFINLGLTDSRWGWQIGPLEAPASHEASIYAGAGQNDLTKGTRVGTLQVDYDGTNVTVSFHALPDYEITETHVYIGIEPVEVIAPGQFLFGGEGQPIYTVGGLDGEPIYVVGHAVVCSQ